MHRSSWELAPSLIGWLALTFCASATGVFVKTGGWYAELIKPEWNPPGWVFGPAWTVLYIMMAVAAWLVWREGGWKAQRGPLTLYLIQWALNALWTPLFFGLQRPGLAFAEILVRTRKHSSTISSSSSPTCSVTCSCCRSWVCPVEKVDCALHVLLVLYDVFTRATPGGLSQVTIDELEDIDDNHWALLRWMESEKPDEANRLCQLAAKSHPEVNAFAFAIGKMIESGISDMQKKEDEYCVRAVRNLVDAFARARRAGGHAT